MLEARDVSFGYAGSALLYRDFNLSVAPGERVALSAPSGFGKTTLCRLLAGYEKPQAGKVLVGGEPLPERGVCPVQLVLQHPELAVDPRMRMADVLAEGRTPGALASAFASDAAKGEAIADAASLGGANSRGPADPEEAEVADAASLNGANSGVFSIAARLASRRAFAKPAASVERLLADPEMCRLMDGLGIQRRWLSRFPHELSGGELQRFCLARALAVRPRYLVADEISTMLDALTQARIWGFLLEELERGDGGLVFVSHSPALVRHVATRVVNLAR